MVGTVQVAKRFQCEFTEQEMNSIVAALGKLDTPSLLNFANDHNLTVLPSYGVNSDLMLFYRKLKSLAGVK